MINGKKQYDMLTGDDFDALVEQNGQSIKDLSWDSYKLGDDSKSYPMWKSAVGYETNATFESLQTHYESLNAEGRADFDKKTKESEAQAKKVGYDLDMTTEPVIFSDFFEAMKQVGSKDADNTGVVKPQAEMGTQNVPEEVKATKTEKVKADQSGAVKVPKSDIKPKAIKSLKTEEQVVVVEKAAKDVKGEVGAVKPVDGMVKQRVPTFTTLTPVNVNGDDLTGIVKAPTSSVKPITHNDTTEEQVVVTKSSFMESMDMVGQFNSLMGE